MILSISEKLQVKLATGAYVLSHSLLAICERKKNTEVENSNQISPMKKHTENYKTV